MSDNDDELEDLPMIFVNSSASNASTFSMPSAEALATQRARELECERELRALRERHAADDAVLPPRCDSSGDSESEAVLTSAVTELRVAAPPPPARAPRPSALLPALARALPAAARAPLAHPAAALRLAELAERAGAAVACDDAPWADDDVWAAGALLAAAALTLDAPARARRALHALLDQRATWDQAQALGRMLLSAVPEAGARLRLCDALRSGGGGAADRLAAQLLQAALLDVLRAGERAALEPALAEGWRRLEPAAGYGAVQLLGRVLAGAPASREPGAPASREARARLLAALAPPLCAPHDAQRPERLKVLVGVDKLRLLFHPEKSP